MALIIKRSEPIIREPKLPPVRRLDLAAERTFVYLKKYLGFEDARRIFNAGQKIPSEEERTVFYACAVQEIEKRLQETDMNVPTLDQYAKFKWKPVSVEEFCFSKQYLGKENAIYPSVMDALIEFNSGKYVEGVLTGGIGSGKTTLALYTNAYQLYLLSCMRNPHAEFGLDPSSEIIFIFQSINAYLAKTVDFARFRSMIAGAPYFKEHYPFDKNLESKLVFPNRVEVVPVSGQETAAIGQNVIGGLIDELNYMAVVEKSKQSVDKGSFDQATAVYNSIARRRKSRFQASGFLPGILCLVSSKKYPGQFTDQKMEEATRDSTIFVYDKRVWEIKPKGTYTKGVFDVFIGDDTRKPRILTETDEVPAEDRKLCMKIPLEFEEDFKKDIINALREIAGVSTLARHPYFVEVERVTDCFGKITSIFEQPEVDFSEKRLRILKNCFFKPELPRFAHVDLGITGDCAGIAIGCVPDFVKLADSSRGGSGYMPKVRFDGILQVVPPRGAEILFFKIREVFVALRRMGMNIRWITYDSFESTDSMQILRQQGFVTGTQSMDVTPCVPYDLFKSALYDGRVIAPEHEAVRKEILCLERDSKTTKIDHPPGGSKDCADAMAGVVYGLTMRREIWSSFGIPLVEIPNAIIDAKDKLKEKNERLTESMARQDLVIAGLDSVRARVKED
jgi:hypothetical protein